MQDISDKLGEQFVIRAATLFRCLGLATLIVSIVTAAIDVSFGGFAPLYWFLIAIFCWTCVACVEVSLLRLSLKSKKEK